MIGARDSRPRSPIPALPGGAYNGARCSRAPEGGDDDAARPRHDGTGAMTARAFGGAPPASVPGS